LRPGWNYIEDNADTSDVGDPIGQGDDAGNGAVGHGTFVSGLIALAAPGAQVLPERVLDGDGTGNLSRKDELHFGAIGIPASLDYALKHH